MISMFDCGVITGWVTSIASILISRRRKIGLFRTSMRYTGGAIVTTGLFNVGVFAYAGKTMDGDNAGITVIASLLLSTVFISGHLPAYFTSILVAGVHKNYLMHFVRIRKI